MEVLIALPFLAFLGEQLSEKTLKLIIKVVSPAFDANPDVANLVEGLVCAIPGFALCMLAGLDLFPAIGVPLAFNGGPILTALIVGFGSNFVHDVIGALPS